MFFSQLLNHYTRTFDDAFAGAAFTCPPWPGEGESRTGTEARLKRRKRRKRSRRTSSKIDFIKGFRDGRRFGSRRPGCGRGHDGRQSAFPAEEVERARGCGVRFLPGPRSSRTGHREANVPSSLDLCRPTRLFGKVGRAFRARPRLGKRAGCRDEDQRSCASQCRNGVPPLDCRAIQIDQGWDTSLSPTSSRTSSTTSTTKAVSTEGSPSVQAPRSLSSLQQSGSNAQRGRAALPGPHSNRTR
jgi:hypothetical protein